MKVTLKKIISLVLVFALCTAFMTGCTKGQAAEAADNSQTDRPAVAFIIGNHANSAEPNLSSPLIAETIEDTIRNYGHITVITVDGTPECVFSGDYDIDERFKSASESKLDVEARAKATKLLQLMENITPSEPEADYLTAINLAVRSLASLDDFTSKTIIMVGSGLSTTGAMNFTNNLLCADSDAIADALYKSGNLPDMTEIDGFYAQQLGDTIAPQKSLTQNQYKKMYSIYDAVVTKAGGNFIIDYSLPVDDNNGSTKELPPVTTIDLPEEVPVNFDSLNISLDSPLALSEQDVRFLPNSSQFFDPSTARATLAPVADFIRESSKKILLCGTTAGDGTKTAEAIQLSADRASAVRDALTSMNCPADSFICVGLANENPWHVTGLGTDESAWVNRRVVLIDATSQTAKEILASAGMQAGE